MLRIEAYTVLDGIWLNLSGVCTGLHHDGHRCELAGIRTLIESGTVEEFGADQALLRTVMSVVQEYPGLIDRMYH